MKPLSPSSHSHSLVNFILDGVAIALPSLLILWVAHLAVGLWIRVRHEWRPKKPAHRHHHTHHPKPHEKEDGLC